MCTDTLLAKLAEFTRNLTINRNPDTILVLTLKTEHDMYIEMTSFSIPTVLIEALILLGIFGVVLVLFCVIVGMFYPGN
jgi:hypothetical protein